MLECRAPRQGHQSENARAACPACGPRMSAASRPTVPSLTPDVHRDAADLSTTSSALELLSHHRETSVRTAVASNPSADADLLRDMHASNATYDVLFAIAGHPNTPGEVLAALALARAEHGALAREQIALRLAGLGVDPRNEEARAMLEEWRWWEMTPSSPEVRLALEVSPNP